MLKKRIALLPVLAVLALLSTYAAAMPPGVTNEDLDQIMPLSKVKAGMKGYALTVFKGTKIEKVDVEILGILRKANNGKDLIFTRVSGGPVTERKANVMHGMSGSPVYVDGKVIGALAMVPISFSREPLCMVTPIEDMLEALDSNLPSQPIGLSSVTAKLDTPVKVGNETISSITIQDPESPYSLPSQGTMVMTPLMTPIMTSGINSKGIAQLTELLKPYGLIPMAGSGAMSDNAVSVELVPGAALGMSLVTGDVDMTGVGTVTYRRGNKLVAFGHPMTEIGPVDAPMTTAYILDVMPGYQISSKLGVPMREVGRIFEDRPWSIAGEIGTNAKMIPVTIDVNDKAMGRKRTLHINVIRHPVVSPILIGVIASQAISQVHGILGDAMAKVDVAIDADQVGKVERKNVYFASAGIENAALGDMQELIGILSGNRFYPLDIKSVDMSIEIESGRKTAAIERIFVDKTQYEPGETINVGIELQPFKADKIVKTVQIAVPENAPDGKIVLRVNGGMVGGEESPILIVPGEGDGPRLVPAPDGTATNIRQALDKYLEQEQNNELITRLLLSTGAVSVAGEKLRNLPDPIANVMKSIKTTGVKMERDDIKVVEPTDYILTGGQSLPITVARRRRAEKVVLPVETTLQQPSTEVEPDNAPAVESDEGRIEESSDSNLSATNIAPVSHSMRVYPPTPAPAEETAAKPDSEPKKDEAKPEEKKDEQQGEKPVTRQPATWVQKSQQDFGGGIFNGTAATDKDDVRLVPITGKLSSLPEDYVWTVLPDGNGGVFAGTGNNGVIYRVGSDGTNSVFFKTNEFEVHSLAKDSKGTLYAGTSPNGKVYRIGADGQGQMILDAPEMYILALAVDSKDNVYAGAGDSGIIYRITPDGQSSKFVEIPKLSTMSLAMDKSDNLYVGAGKGGLILKVTPDAVAAPIYDAEEDSVSSLVVDGEGNVYAGTGTDKGMIYRIPASGVPKPVFDKAPRALSMVVDAQNNVYTVSDDKIFMIHPDESAMQIDTGNAAAQFISLAMDQNGTIYAGTANTAAIFCAQAAKEGVYESPIHDAGLNARWSRISWIADMPEGSSVALQTRTGNSADPDKTWSSWSTAYANEPGQKITSPAARYIQYRAMLTGKVDGAPILKQVTASYLTDNRPPTVKVNEPQASAVVSRTYEIKWEGSDPDKDALNYDLYYSADSGATWQALGSGLKQEKNDAPAPEVKPVEPAAPQQVEGTLNVQLPEGVKPDVPTLMAKLKEELDKHPEIPQQIKDQILAQAPAQLEAQLNQAAAGVQPQAPQPPKPADNGEKQTTKETSYKWDTTKIPDGTYWLKVIASDRTSNAVGFLSEEKKVGPIIVVNTPPVVKTFKKELVVNPDKTVSVNGYAYDSLIPVTGVQYKIDEGDWMSAEATDGMFDSISEPFAISTQPLKSGSRTIGVKAIDAAGNAAEVKVTAEIPEDKKEEPASENIPAEGLN